MNGTRANRGAIVAGVVFIALGIGVILDQSGVVVLDLALLVPVALILGGAALLLAGWRRDDRDES
jgi:uncharacterized membrane protein HdeD (DUF308 family)